MNVTIERAASSDIEELICIQNESFLSDYLAYGYCPGYGRTQESMQDSLDGRYVFKILCNNRIVGDIIIKQKGENDYFLSCICIVPDYENTGIGQIAMQFVFDSFPCAKHWSLETPLFKQRNHYFYKKHGFEITQEYADGGVAVCLFEKFCK